jgi:hypothetical protein
MPISSDVFTAQGGSAEWDFLAIAGNKPTWTPKYGYTTYTQGSDPRFKIGGSFHGWFYGVVGTGGYAWDDGNKAGPDVNQYSDFAGVLGTGVYVTGVAGTSVNNIGVYGQSGEAPESWIRKDLHGGVVGMSYHSPGVMAWAAESPGVVGFSSYNSGVFGGSDNTEPGVFGISYFGTSSGVFGQSVNEGPMPGPNLPTNAGVVGSSSALPGVIGSSKMSAGVLGFSDNIGVYGVSSNSASYAGFFRGNVMVTNALAATVKHAVVPFPDGTQRLLHCMESPEHWFEDFGAAKLKRGRAVVKLDADFAKVIKSGDYRVFVTPEGDCRGLYVRRKSAKSFEVRELTGGTSSIAFSYRIVGRRKDIKGHRRFAKIDARVQLPAAARAPRKPAPTAPGLRAFAAPRNKGAPERRPKSAEKGGRSRAFPRGSRPSIRPQLQLSRAEKK